VLGGVGHGVAIAANNTSDTLSTDEERLLMMGL